MRRLLATTLLALFPAVTAAQDVGGLEVGTKAPAAAVQTLDGKAADLAQYFGKGPVLVEFWATWCPNCRSLEPQVQAIARKYAGKVQIVTVAVSVNQSPERVRAYVQRRKVPGVVLFDRKGNATGAYDVPATSYVLVVDRTGKIVYTGMGADQNLEAALRKAL